MHGIGEIAERLRRQTVEVISYGGRGCGSGVIWPGSASRIVTNAHVFNDAGMVRFADGSESPARLTRIDRRRDLAALEVSIATREAARVRDSGQVHRGELVIAIGNPLGFTGALSTGVVHAVGPVAGLGHRAWIQAQVRLAPGNSGGPLADAEGRVIGINSMVVSGGLGLAIPSSAVSVFLARASDPIRLGVTLRPVHRGLMLLEVEKGSLAEGASLLPGDILLYESADDIGDALDRGGLLRLEFLRGGSTSVRRVAIPLTPARAVAAA
jgi:serine protease Do